MLIVDSQIHIWQNGKMSAHHRQIPTYSAEDALAEMKTAGVDCAEADAGMASTAKNATAMHIRA